MAKFPKLSKEQARILEILIDGGEIDAKDSDDGKFVKIIHNDPVETIEMISKRTFEKLRDYSLIKKRDNGNWS